MSNPDEKPSTKRDADIFEAAIDEREKIEAEIIQAEILVESCMLEEISKEVDFACDISFLFGELNKNLDRSIFDIEA